MPVDPRILKYYGILEDDPSQNPQSDLNPTQELETLYKDQPPAGKSGVYATDTSKYFSGAAPGFIPALNDSFAQLGTLHGKTSDTTPPWRYLASMGRDNEAKDRQTGLKMKTLQYLQDQRQKNKDLYNDRVAKYGENALKRDFDAGEAEKKRGFDAGEAEKKRKFDSKQLATKIAGGGGGGAGGAGGVGGAGTATTPVEARNDKERDYRYVNLRNNAQILKDLIDQNGTTGGFFGSAGGKMDALIYDMAIDYAKMVDPQSVARDSEVKAANQYLLPMRDMGGLTMSNQTAKELVDNFIESLDRRLGASYAGKRNDINAKTYIPTKEGRGPGMYQGPDGFGGKGILPPSPMVTNPGDPGQTNSVDMTTLQKGEVPRGTGHEGQTIKTLIVDKNGKGMGTVNWVFKNGKWLLKPKAVKGK